MSDQVTIEKRDGLYIIMSGGKSLEAFRGDMRIEFIGQRCREIEAELKQGKSWKK